MGGARGLALLYDIGLRPIVIHGVNFILASQKNLKRHEYSLMWVHVLSRPELVYTLIFPTLFHFNLQLGLQVLFCCAIAEHLCLLLKLIIGGGRPYWYIYECPYFIIAPRITQFPDTCLSTPGTPSENSMITACYLYVITDYVCRHAFTYRRRRLASAITWTLFYAIQAGVLVSAAYLASSFPHQCLIGSITGILLAKRLLHISLQNYTLDQYIWMSILMFLSFICTVSFVWVCGQDPLWAMDKARKSCVKMLWVEPGNPLLETCIRTAAVVLGLGVTLKYMTSLPLKCTDKSPLIVKMVHVACSVVTVTFFNNVLNPRLGLLPYVWHLFTFIKNCLGPLLIIRDLPILTALPQVILGSIFGVPKRHFYIPFYHIEDMHEHRQNDDKPYISRSRSRYQHHCDE